MSSISVWSITSWKLPLFKLTVFIKGGYKKTKSLNIEKANHVFFVFFLKWAHLLVYGIWHTGYFVRNLTLRIAHDRIYNSENGGIEHGSGACLSYSWWNIKIYALEQLRQDESDIKNKSLIRIKTYITRNICIAYDEEIKNKEDTKSEKWNATVDSIEREQRRE